MSLPSMADALTCWEESFPVKAVTCTSVDFADTEVVTARPQLCVVQVASKEELSKGLTLDWSREYVMCHSRFALAIDEYIEFEGNDYKVIALNNYGRYGYWEVVGEETKRDLLVVA